MRRVQHTQVPFWHASLSHPIIYMRIELPAVERERQRTEPEEGRLHIQKSSSSGFADLLASCAVPAAGNRLSFNFSPEPPCPLDSETFLPFLVLLEGFLLTSSDDVTVVGCTLRAATSAAESKVCCCGLCQRGAVSSSRNAGWVPWRMPTEIATSCSLMA